MVTEIEKLNDDYMHTPNFMEVKPGGCTEIDCGELPIHKAFPNFTIKAPAGLTKDQLNNFVQQRLDDYEKFKNALEEIESLDTQDFEDGKFLDRLLPDDYLERWIFKTKQIARKALGYD